VQSLDWGLAYGEEVAYIYVKYVLGSIIWSVTMNVNDLCPRCGGTGADPEQRAPEQRADKCCQCGGSGKRPRAMRYSPKTLIGRKVR
jgi:DnaJ-class molecular chaperone